MTADAYIKHHSYKQCNIATDPLAKLLNNIDSNPGVYNNKQVVNSIAKEDQSIGQTANKPNQQGTENTEHSTKRTNTNKKEGTAKLEKNIYARHEGEVTMTILGCIIKKPDRLTYA